jgi:hypothetical protein
MTCSGASHIPPDSFPVVAVVPPFRVSFGHSLQRSRLNAFPSRFPQTRELRLVTRFLRPLLFECRFYFGFFPDAFTLHHPPPYSVRFIIRTSYCPRVFTTTVTCPYDASYRCPCMWFNAGRNYFYLLRCPDDLSRRSRVLLCLTLTVLFFLLFVLALPNSSHSCERRVSRL